MQIIKYCRHNKTNKGQKYAFCVKAAFDDKTRRNN